MTTVEQCPGCRAEIAVGARVCGKCSLELHPPCPRCQARNPAHFRFCGMCGEPFRQALLPRASGRERRQLTVLFCDLTGSTSLSTRLDAEDLAEIIDRYFALCRGIFERHGGYVDSDQGDCLRVYFGYPQSHDDDAMNAARAALEAVAAVRRLGTELHGRTGTPLEVHIGLHTGEVVAGELAREPGGGPLIVGVVPNVAKRLEESASSGSVLVSAATRRLVGPAFVCVSVGRLDLKGLPAPVEAFRLLDDRGFTGAFETLGARKLTPLLGRDEEMALLERSWRRVRDGHGQVVLVSGEAGIGKSRLVHALAERLAGDACRRHVLQCRQPFANSALFPLTEMLRALLRFAREDDAGEKRAKLDAAFRSGLLPHPAAAERVAALLALPLDDATTGLPARRQREETLEWLVAWLAGGSASEPVLLVVEDAQWADATTLEFAASAAAALVARHAMLVLTYRPEFSPGWPMRSHTVSLALKRLGADQTRALAQSIAGQRLPPPALLEQIAERSEGVPLYVEELTAMLLERGAIESPAIGPQHGNLDGEAAAPPVSIPQTLRGSLMARLDHLPSSKPVAQMAAVLGREFPRRLAASVGRLDDDVLQSALDELIEADLLFQCSSTPEPSYAFKHVLVQEAAYLSLLKPQRAEFHDRTARALAEHFPEVARTNPEIIASHCAAAGRHAEAVDGWHRAGIAALEASAEVEAVAHLKQALVHLASVPAGAERDAREVRCLITLGSALAETRGYGATEVEETFGRVYRLCEGLGDSDELYSALTGLHAFYQVRCQLKRAVDTGRALVRLSEGQPEPLRRAQAHRCLGWSLFCTGEMPAAATHLETTLGLFDRRLAGEHSRIHGMHPWVAGLSNSALLQWFIGRPDDALVRCRRALDLARELRHPMQLAYALSVSAAVHTCRNEPAEVLPLVQEVQRLAGDDALPYWAAWASTLGGWARAMLGHDADGLALLREALDRYRATGAALFEPWSLALLAEVHVAAGRPEQALTAIDSALVSPLLADGHFFTPELYRLKGRLLLDTGGDLALAQRCTRHALQVATSQGAIAFSLRAGDQLAAWRDGAGQRGPMS